MSKKYQERLLHASGVSSKSFSSAFGSKILQKFGWKEGAGLGAEEEGRTDCVQIKRREQQVGLGAEKDQKAGDDWNNWWSDVYNTAAKGVQVSNDAKNSKITVDDSSDSSDSDDDNNAGGRVSCIKGARHQLGKLRRVLRQEAPASTAPIATKAVEVQKVPSPVKEVVEKAKKEKKEKRAEEEEGEEEVAEDEAKKAKKEKKEKKRKRESAEAEEAVATDEPEKKKKKKKEKKEKKSSEDDA